MYCLYLICLLIIFNHVPDHRYSALLNVKIQARLLHHQLLRFVIIVHFSRSCIELLDRIPWQSAGLLLFNLVMFHPIS